MGLLSKSVILLAIVTMVIAQPVVLVEEETPEFVGNPVALTDVDGSALNDDSLAARRARSIGIGLSAGVGLNAGVGLSLGG